MLCAGEKQENAERQCTQTLAQEEAGQEGTGGHACTLEIHT